MAHNKEKIGKLRVTYGELPLSKSFSAAIFNYGKHETERYMATNILQILVKNLRRSTVAKQYTR